jgi:hypothetical protein
VSAASELRAAWLALVMAVASSGCGEDKPECSPCPPGEHASNPSVSCSACVPLADAGLPDAASKDARPDATADADARPCDLDARITCAQGSLQGDVGICADVAEDGLCVDGTWVCPAGSIDTGYCTCDGAPAPGCATCTPHGYVCADAGTDADARADAATCASAFMETCHGG